MRDFELDEEKQASEEEGHDQAAGGRRGQEEASGDVVYDGIRRGRLLALQNATCFVPTMVLAWSDENRVVLW